MPRLLALAASLLLAITTLTATLTPAYAAPPGSYLASCSTVTQADRVLTATCWDKGGTSHRTSLDIGYCRGVGGNISNIDGQLRCAENPGGSYQQSCSVTDHWIALDGILYARCRNMNGDWINSSIPFHLCDGGQIANIDGRLTCVGY